MFVIELLFDPDGYFDREEYGITFPALVLGGIVIASLVRAAVQFTTIGQSIEQQGARTGLAIQGLSSMVASVFTPLVICLVYAVVIYALARFVGGTGTFRRTFWSVAHGFLPWLLGSIVFAAATAMAVSGVAPPESVDGIGPFLARFRGTVVYQIGKAFNLAALLWCGFLWVFATKHVHEVDELDGVVAAGLPVVLTVALAFLGVGLV